jgi:Ti-type conjugative transfer relaxase TraA
MAIAFARLQYVSRSSGGNACLKSAYNERSQMTCERSGQTFFFKHRDGNICHEILLPEEADSRFSESSVLWNAAEFAEKRQNSQIARDMVLALPDDPQVTLEDKIEMTRRFAQENFVDKGLAVQMDIHAPHEGEKNWHAHYLITTRRFTEDGQALGEKARDLDSAVRFGKVVEGEAWGETWRDFQNAYFLEKGYELVVDPTAVIGQEHLGPVRMRRFAGDSEIALRADLIRQTNEHLSHDPEAVLQMITRNKATFTVKDIDWFLNKHVEDEERASVRQNILQSEHLVALLPRRERDPLQEENQPTSFTTTWVREEEERIQRFAMRIHDHNDCWVSKKITNAALEKYSLNEEQKKAFLGAVGRDQETAKDGLVVIQGRAGTGKSYTLKAIQEAYSKDGYDVIGLAPTHVVAQDLKNEAGFKKAKTVHKMLFDHKNDREGIEKGSVLVVDEAGMLGNEVMTELLHVAMRSRSKVILVGDDRQLSSVARGGMFGYLSDHFGSYTLTDVRRQEQSWQKEMAVNLSQGDVKSALSLLQEHDRIHWNLTERQAMSSLVKEWTLQQQLDPDKDCLILTHTNAKVEVFNKEIHAYRHEQDQLGEVEYECLTQRGKTWSRINVSVGDRLQLTQTNKELGLCNGMRGTLVDVKEQDNSYTFTLQQDNGQTISFNPEMFHGFTLGYASTVYKAQGKTVPTVLVYHDGQGSRSLSYVGLTRHQQDVHLFVTEEKTSDWRELVSQMSRDENKQASLFYTTPQEIQEKKEQKQKDWERMHQQSQEGKVSHFIKHTLKDSLLEWAGEVTTRVRDHFYRNDAFYTPVEQKVTPIDSYQQKRLIQQIVEKTEHREAEHTLTCQGPAYWSQAIQSQYESHKVCKHDPRIPEQIQQNSERDLTGFLTKQVPLLMKQYHLEKPEAIPFDTFAHRVVETYQEMQKIDPPLSSDRFYPGLLAQCAYMHNHIYHTAQSVMGYTDKDLTQLTQREQNSVIRTALIESQLWYNEAKLDPKKASRMQSLYCDQAREVDKNRSEAIHQDHRMEPFFKKLDLSCNQSTQSLFQQSLQQHKSLEKQQELTRELSKGFELSL